MQRYLEQKFGPDLKAVRSAMSRLAKSYKPGELAAEAYPLYERFRPEVPEREGSRARRRTCRAPMAATC